MTGIPVGVIVGSNRRLALALTRLVEDRFAWRWIRIDDLPMYNQDLKPDRPETVRRFTADVASLPALLFVTPEHNRSLPAVLKNAIDWGSKPTGNRRTGRYGAGASRRSPARRSATSAPRSASSTCGRSWASSA